MILLIVYREYKLATTILQSIECKNKSQVIKKRRKLKLEYKNTDIKIKEYVSIR
jgi:hypothetical protein